jgi:hypothetical protein
MKDERTISVGELFGILAELKHLREQVNHLQATGTRANLERQAANDRVRGMLAIPGVAHLVAETSLAADVRRVPGATEMMKDAQGQVFMLALAMSLTEEHGNSIVELGAEDWQEWARRLYAHLGGKHATADDPRADDAQLDAVPRKANARPSRQVVRGGGKARRRSRQK